MELKSELREHTSKYGSITDQNIFELLAELIHLAERFTESSGKEKRGAVLEAIELAVNAMPESEERTAVLEMLRSGVIERSINLAITIARLPAFNRLCAWIKFKCCCCL
jgi:hypothetical protein